MRKYLIIVGMMLMSAVTAFAEEGDKWAGINLNGGFRSGYTNFGLGGKFQYEIKPSLRLEGAANYFFKRKGTSMWDVNVNIQYLIPLGDRANVYPIIGPTLMTYKGDASIIDITDYTTKFGFNGGAGIEYILNDHLKVNADVKYQYIKNVDRPVISIGAAYML